MRALIVDDKSENRYLLRALLQGHGYAVEEARHGAEALAKARQVPPHLVISDLLMPVMDGYTLLRHWKSDERLKAIPFVVYTATYTESKDEQLALDLGADAFIIKPAEPEGFMERVREVLAQQKRGELLPPQAPQDDEEALLKQYSEVLVRKLEAKALQLQQTNRAQQEEITRRRQAEAALSESAARQGALSRRLLIAHEEERRRVALELHDEVGQALSAVRFNLSALEHSLGVRGAQGALADSFVVIDGAIEVVRTLSLDLRPTILDDLGLVPALKWYCERQSERSGTPIVLEAGPIEVERGSVRAITCYRIVQEALTNALRHAGAKKVEVSLQASDGGFVLRVSDDGKGFDALDERHRRGSGLSGMAERAALAGARFALSTQAGKGTRIEVEFAPPATPPA